MRGPALLAALVFLGHSHVAPAEESDRFAKATNLIAEERYPEAVTALVSLADDLPDDSFADDALFSAAVLCEERLSDPRRALELYERILRDYASSRVALASERRASALKTLLGTTESGADALAAFEDILQKFPERGQEESTALAHGLLETYPDWEGRPKVLIWLGTVEQRAQRFDRALSLFVEAARLAPESEFAFEARRRAGDVAIELGDFSAAEAHYRAMPTFEDPAHERTLEESLDALAMARLRARLYTGAFAALAAVLIALALSLRTAAGSWSRALAQLLRPPTEVIFMLPIAALLVAAALTTHQELGPAVTIICGGGLVLVWLSGAGMAAARRAGRAARLRGLAHIIATAIGVVAICYIAIHRTRLIDLIVSTVRFGPDV